MAVHACFESEWWSFSRAIFRISTTLLISINDVQTNIIHDFMYFRNLGLEMRWRSLIVGKTDTQQVVDRDSSSSSTKSFFFLLFCVFFYAFECYLNTKNYHYICNVYEYSSRKSRIAYNSIIMNPVYIIPGSANMGSTANNNI